MKANKKYCLTQKAEGDGNVVTGAVVIITTAIVILLLMTIITDYYKLLTKLSDAEMVVRNTILQMEINGQLTKADGDVLVKRLEAHGISDIQLSGNIQTGITIAGAQITSTLGSAAYGTRVTLQVRCVIPTNDLVNEASGGLMNWRSRINRHVVTIAKDGVSVK